MKKGLITSILALTFSGLQAQPLPASPKLVVTLTIDQLRTDYMEAFSSLYGEKGFKRLLREGKVFRQAEFPFCGTDRASAIAAIYTGTTPSMNGIIAEQWLDAGTLRPINCVEDPNFMGNYTDESTVPRVPGTQYGGIAERRDGIDQTFVAGSYFQLVGNSRGQ